MRRAGLPTNHIQRCYVFVISCIPPLSRLAHLRLPPPPLRPPPPPPRMLEETRGLAAPPPPPAPAHARRPPGTAGPRAAPTGAPRTTAESARVPRPCTPRSASIAY